MKSVSLLLSLCVVGSLGAPGKYGSQVYEAPIVKSSYETGYPSTKASAPFIPIIKYLKNDNNYGTYNFEVQSGDGTSQSESGSLKSLTDADGHPVQVNVKKGSYSYQSPDGQTLTVDWYADETGFHPSAPHIPTPPPVPQAIQDSLALPRVADPFGHSE